MTPVNAAHEQSESGSTWYRRARRRMLVDMHIPDWDEAFLAKYDPAALVAQYERAGVNSVMFYCQAHTGLCNWPTKTGKLHANLAGRDVVAETIELLKRRDIATCAYYCVIFNNWAFLEHPDWRVAAANERDVFVQGRAGCCCPNNPDHHAFALAQAAELAGRYAFDGFFFDMTFWPQVCLCTHCRARYRQESAAEIPTVVDWTESAWCRFQSTRERWMSEFAGELTATVKRPRPDLTVYHNFATSICNWICGLPTSSAVHHDFLGGDFYGDSHEQLLVIKMMTNLTESRPAEFMTSRCIDLTDHLNLKRFDRMELQAHAATLFSSAFLFIDAIDPIGTVNPAVYERIGRIYAETARYEPWLGGEPVEDIAIYFSSDSKMDFAENGTDVSNCGFSRTFPHYKAVVGAIRILQEAHLPFGVITRKQLANLDSYQAVVLPNVLRMDAEEVAAFRAYVECGGRLYASGWTSLTETRGQRHDDFMLADVFGCHFAADDLGRTAYLKPRDAGLSRLITPQEMVGVQTGRTLRLDARAEGEALATLTLPYASPHPGSISDQNWASFHSSPPWTDTQGPFVVRNTFGRGRAIYCAADLEGVGVDAADKVFLHLIQELMDTPPTYSADTHPCVWMNVIHQPEHSRYLIGFLNHQAQLPAIPITQVPFTLRPLPVGRIKRLIRLPDETAIDFVLDRDGTLHAEVAELRTLEMLLAEM